MRVCVMGLWHLGCVTAGCLAAAGHDVVGLDADPEVIAELRKGVPPLFEPGLEQLIKDGLASGALRFETDGKSAVIDADVLWVTFDTPVDDDDCPQVEAVAGPVADIVPELPDGCLVLISSQLPVGTTRRLAGHAGARATFAYSPENLRLGKAIEVFTRPDRVVVGLQSEADRGKVTALLAPFTSNVVWMDLEAAEMTKHAINAFLATSVAFMNEIAALCEMVGADAKDVERGLKSEERIGPKAYLSPGGAYAGGTLARDVTTLADLGRKLDVPIGLLSAVRDSNSEHRSWALRKLKARHGTLSGRRIAILGLTYKSGTSTLRRSAAVELALSLGAEGATVVAFDPAIHELPSGLAGQICLAGSPAAALAHADAVVLSTPWPKIQDLDWPGLIASMKCPIVIDANWVLAGRLRSHPGIAYAAVGLPWSVA
ncbi:MAG TPA: nucleotide sugar dehydrogenase [Xanthobacteraceae bacterium]|jgi:UDPglucose 6-dehydrogenase|nr:nucleotide sugar dehydrogenase [Xanthobacteraceae bacterium]